ncbi:porin family protein [Rhodohalobacter halophilus]|uniref:porin family protein n=1 Tax=Rhodohalobacter halophilus TaxID=1812810 RepID=UPI00083F9AF3|nr:porin family protein [Rhodohalobacter halophilus]
MIKTVYEFTQRTLSLLTLLLIIGFTSINVQAQDVSYGLKGGVNFTTHYDAQFDADAISTFRIGAFTNVPLGSTPFSFQPEVFYYRNGSKSSFQSDDIVYTGTYRTDYIKVPLLIAYSPDVFKQLHTKFFTGPSVSFLIRSKFSESSRDMDLEDMTNNVDFGLLAGLELKAPSLSERLSLELRFSRGLSEVYDSGFNPESNSEFSRPNRNTAISILLGYTF